MLTAQATSPGGLPPETRQPGTRQTGTRQTGTGPPGSGPPLIRPAWLPEALKPAAFSLEEGLRAALAVGAVIALDVWLERNLLHIAAVGALLVCLGDSGGPIRPRARAALAFALLGAAAFAGFALLRDGNPWTATALATLALFAAGFARVWGPAATGVGNMLTMAVVIAVGHPIGAEQAAWSGLAFLAGCGWAAAVTLLIWRLDPGRAADAAVAAARQALARMLAGLDPLLRQGTEADRQRRLLAENGALRDAIEAARASALDGLRGRANALPRVRASLAEIDLIEDLFGLLIALAALLDRPTTREEGEQLLATLQARPPYDAAGATALGAVPLTDGALIAWRAAVRARLVADPPGRAAEPVRGIGVLVALRSNLSVHSAILRHAARCAVVGGAALLWTLLWPHPFQQWLTIALVLTMQPFTTVTWQRALERSLGTLVGAGVAGGLSLLVGHGAVWLLALAYPLLCGLAFALRRVSFGLFIAFLTPCMLIFAEAAVPVEAMGEVAALRAGYTILGGLLAVLAAALLWPSWETARIGPNLAQALSAHAAYAAAALAPRPDAAALRLARRAAGLATNNLEASIARRLQEPAWHGADGAAGAIAADAALRRIAALLLGLAYAGTPGREALPNGLRAWLPAALTALAEAEPLPARPPLAQPDSAQPQGTVAALLAQVEALARAMAPGRWMDRAAVLPPAPA